ncbi:Pr6Pr family membrane protein [Nesterenkonia pannonica]|uniref:Pr6Pr family membrane protein n=1 Tax=Nesterenkonia pannonica TaxID=1548602 RepID=UPI0021646CDA|nr:Pr6Pr family membrane protein [Nesterenkonia pannonica]
MLFNDTVLHVAVPVLVPLIWAAVGPHGTLSARIVLASTAIPVAWLAATLLRGPQLDWYPYTILDVPTLGYSGISVYVVSILALYLMLALGFLGLDRLLLRAHSGSEASALRSGTR